MYSYGYLQASAKEFLIAFLTLSDGPYGFSFELSFTILDKGLGLYFFIYSAVKIEGAIISPPIPIEDLNHSRLDCIII